MTAYTPDTLASFLEQVRASNLSRSAKAIAGQLTADAIALSAKVKALEAQLEKLQQQRVNETVNQPSSKKPEWDKGNGENPDKPRRERKLGGPRPGSGSQPKTNPEPDRSIHNSLEQCPNCQTDLTRVPPANDVNQRIIEDIEPPAEKTVLTEETSERKWCPSCQQIVSAKSELALPRSDIGLHATVRIVYLWVVAALSLLNIQKYLSTFMRLGISTSGISNLLVRVAAILAPVAEETYAVTTDATGNVYFVSDNCVFKLEQQNGVLTRVAGNSRVGYSGDGGPAINAQLRDPMGVAVDGAGNLFIADSRNYRIRKVSINGIITTVAGNGTYGFSGDGGPATSAQLLGAQGVALDGDGNLFIADTIAYPSSYGTTYKGRNNNGYP